MKYSAENHSFIICAYKENPHLEETIQSLMKQTVSSTVYLSTSTPNDYVRQICDRNNIEIYINPVQKNAGTDWNFAYSQAKTELVTIAHQDDIYEDTFLEKTLFAANKYDNAIIFFTNYYELKLGKKEVTNTLLKVKSLMNWALKYKMLNKSKFIRRRILSFGCPINCPSVTYNVKIAGEQVFDTTYINSCDYKTWVDLSKKKGRFVYINEQLMGHRIYAESATSKNLGENIRKKEDYEILKIFWPSPIAKIINRIYSTSEKSNKI